MPGTDASLDGWTPSIAPSRSWSTPSFIESLYPGCRIRGPPKSCETALQSARDAFYRAGLHPFFPRQPRTCLSSASGHPSYLREARFSSLVPSFGPEEFHEARPSSTLDNAPSRARLRDSVTRRRSVIPATNAPHNKEVMCGRRHCWSS